MTTTLTWVRYGRPATAALRDAVAEAKAGDPLAPVTVVVPSNGVGVAARRQLASGAYGRLGRRGSGLAAVSFLTVYRLAELLGAAKLAAGGRRPVSTPVIAAALRRALAWPSVFAEVAGHPATETALLQAYRELRDCSETARRALEGRSPRAADVVRLTGSARRLLEERFFDEEDLLETACSVLEADRSVLEAFGPVVVYLPERLSRHGARLLATVGTRQALRVVAGTTGDKAADAEVISSLDRLFDGATRPDPAEFGALEDVVSAERTRLVSTSDADEEVREAVRAVVDAARLGTPLDRIALLYAAREPYARLLHDQLRAAGIEYNGSSVLTPAMRVAGRTLLGLLGLAGHNMRREDVFSWLSGARLLHDGQWVPVGAWERISRDAGVVAGRDDWDRRLDRYGQECRVELLRIEADPDAPSWQAERLTTKIERSFGLRSFILGLFDELEAAGAADRSWSARARWAKTLLRRLLGDERARGQWPPDEQKAADRVERALDRLGCLDEVEPTVELEVFVRTLALELEQDLGRVGRMGEGVLVGSIGMGLGQELDLLVVLGLVEGSFPSPVHDDSLLPDHEREATGGELARREQAVERQHRQLLAALAGSGHQLLCIPRGDLRKSAERVPSRWALDVGSILAGSRLWSEDLLATSAGWIGHSASYDAALRELVSPATAREYRLRSIMAGGGGQRALSTLGDAALESGAAVLRGRRSDRFTRFDGNLHGLALPSPVDRAVSATALEAWAKCPFGYLARHVLGVEEIERPEDRLRISPADRGTLVHAVLERFVAEALAAGRPAPGQPWTPADRNRLRAIAEELCEDYEARGLVGRALFWSRERPAILADLDRFLEEDSDHRALLGSQPVVAELAFGLRDAALGTVGLTITDGRTVPFRGKADRVDLASDGTLEVLDYKTGKASDYANLSDDNPDDGGRHLQLAVYGLAARAHQDRADAEVTASYWFVSRRGGFKRLGYRVTADVLERVGDTVGHMVENIEAGVFAPAPTASSTAQRVECPYCEPDRLGVVDLKRQMERKRADPALRGYLEFVGKLEPDEEGSGV